MHMHDTGDATRFGGQVVLLGSMTGQQTLEVGSLSADTKKRAAPAPKSKA